VGRPVVPVQAERPEAPTQGVVEMVATKQGRRVSVGSRFLRAGRPTAVAAMVQSRMAALPRARFRRISPA
jgi:hypothetical protein